MRIIDEQILTKGLKSLETATPPTLYNDIMRTVRTYQEKRNPFSLWVGLGSVAVAVLALALIIAIPHYQPETASMINDRSDETTYGISSENKEIGSTDSFSAKPLTSRESSPGLGGSLQKSNNIQDNAQSKLAMDTNEGFVMVKTYSSNPDYLANYLLQKLSGANATISSNNGTRMVTMLVPSDKVDGYINQIAQTNCRQSNYMEVQKLLTSGNQPTSVRILVQISK